MNNIWTVWGDVFNASLQGLWWGLLQFVPRLVLALLFFAVGWILGSLVSRAFEHVVRLLKVDNLLNSMGVGNFLRKAGLNLNSGYFVGEVMKWFVLVVFMLPSLNLVGLDYVASFLKDDVLLFLPRVLVAISVLIAATLLSDFVSKTVLAGSRAMSLSSTNMLASFSKYIIWIFAFVVALDQLGVAPGFMNILFTGIVGMLSLGGALAFGLGGKDAAARLIARLGDEMSEK